MKLIQTEEYLLLIDEEAEIKEGTKWVYDKDNPSIIPLLGNTNIVKEGISKGWFVKIIAYYPLTKEAEELDLPLLPNPFEDMNYDELEIKYYQELEEKRLAAINFKGQVAGRHPDNLSSREIHAKVSGFIEGYKAASKQFSLEDIKKAIEMARIGFKNYPIDSFKSINNYIKSETNKIIQSLSTQQLPKEFIMKKEPIYEERYVSEMSAYMPYCIGEKPWIITNSEGKEELVGTYKY